MAIGWRESHPRTRQQHEVRTKTLLKVAVCIGNSNQLFLHALTVPPDGEAISDPFARYFVKIPLSIGFIGRCVDPSRPIWMHSDRHAQAQAARDSRRGCRTVLALRIRLLGRQAAAAPVSMAARGQANPDA
jgi:hypothetical protein